MIFYHERSEELKIMNLNKQNSKNHNKNIQMITQDS